MPKNESDPASSKRDELLNLYKLFVEEEHWFIGDHQNRVKSYAGFAAVMIAAIIAGVFKSSEWLHFAFLACGTIPLALVAEVAIQATSRDYRRFLETVSMRAKIEQQIGLTQTPIYANTDDNYWPEEPIISTRHLKDRRRYKTSEKWMTESVKTGYQFWVKVLFRGVQGVAVLLCAVLLVTMCSALNK